MFSPQSLYWRVNREWLIALMGPRAVLLELAHPAIAAGVARHSNYRGDPFGRLYRTMKTMTEISFGTPEERATALVHFQRCHARVRGEGYDARDPHLQFWVLATLIDSVPLAYETFVAPLSHADKSAYYADCQRLAQVMGIADKAIPPTYAAFEDYMREMVNGDRLRVSDDGRAVIEALFAPTLRGTATRWFSFASIGMLPPRIREQYGFAWDAGREKNLERLVWVIGRVRPLIPTALAIHPKAWSSERRFRRAAMEAG